MRNLFVIILILMVLPSSAQDTSTSYSMDVEDRLDRMMELVLEEDEKRQSMDGFRIQIGLNRNRTLAQEFRALFMKAYPDVPSYITYQAPNFKIRVGDFETKLSALKARAEFTGEYSDAFIVKTQIKIMKSTYEEPLEELEELDKGDQTNAKENKESVEPGQ